jgi:hypothetical protein
MATSPVNVINLTQDALAKWLVEDDPKIAQIARVWPLMGIEGGMLTYARTAVLTPASILGDGTSGIASITPAVGSPTTFTLGELAARYKLDYSAQDRWKVPNNVDATLAAIAVRQCMYGCFRKLDVVTSGGPGDYPSLYDLCAATQLFASTNGTPAQRLDELQMAYQLVTANNGHPTAIMCNRRGKRWITAAYQEAGLNLEYVECEWTDPMKGVARGPQMAINGTPIYINDLIETTDVPEEFTRIYFMVLGDSGEASPTRGVTGIVPAPLKDTLFVRRESSEPAAGTTSLINVDYTFPVGNALGSSGALSILEGVNVTAYPNHPGA